MPEVVFLTRILTHYRVPFHDAVRKELASAGINYRVLHGAPRRDEASKGDTADLDWSEPATNLYLGPSDKLVWQRVLGLVRGADLVIMGQENALLSNYALHLWRRFGGPRLAFFGHGRNFQSRRPRGLAERFKRLWMSQVDWWFAYTELSADIVASAGVPRDRITVFNNAIDTSGLRQEMAQLDPIRQHHLRQELFSGSNNIGVYVGGLYAEKRLRFLLDAAEQIRARVPDFQLLVVGGGPEADLVEQAAAKWPWLHYVGPRFGLEKTRLVALARVFLMPGLVGLGVLDAFAYGLPMITTDISYHSPEFAYLRDGENGMVVRSANDAAGYADDVAVLLLDRARLERLARNAAASAEDYTIEAMAHRFANGVRQALRASPPSKRL